jgi:hypothetical protein
MNHHRALYKMRRADLLDIAEFDEANRLVSRGDCERHHRTAPTTAEHRTCPGVPSMVRRRG